MRMFGGVLESKEGREKKGKTILYQLLTLAEDGTEYINIVFPCDVL